MLTQVAVIVILNNQ